MNKKIAGRIELALAPSRFSELPTLIPVYNSESWPVLSNQNLSTPYSCMVIKNTRKDFCVSIHDIYEEELEIILCELEESFEIIDRFIITAPIDNEELVIKIKHLLTRLNIDSKSVILPIDNIGRNIKPLMIDAWPQISQYRYCLHMHTKRTKGNGVGYGEQWLNSICSSIANNTQIKSSLYMLETNNRLGIIMPKPFNKISNHSLSWAGTGEKAYKLFSSYLNYLKTSQISIIDFYSKPLVYPVGGMMLFRVDCLKPMQNWLQRNTNYLNIPEPLPTQSSLHAIERLFTLCSEYSGYTWCILDRRNTETYYLDSLEHSMSLKDSTISLYTKAINISIHDKDYAANQLLKLESKLRFKPGIKYIIQKVIRKFSYILGHLIKVKK